MSYFMKNTKFKRNLNIKPQISFGIPFLDSKIAQKPYGSLVLLQEDAYSHTAQIFLKIFLAHNIHLTENVKIFALVNGDKSLKIPTKCAKNIGNAEVEDKLLIAWRYKGLSLEVEEPNYDLNKTIDIRDTKCSFENNISYDDAVQLMEKADEKSVFVIFSLFSPYWNDIIAGVSNKISSDSSENKLSWEKNVTEIIDKLNRNIQNKSSLKSKYERHNLQDKNNLSKNKKNAELVETVDKVEFFDNVDDNKNNMMKLMKNEIIFLYKMKGIVKRKNHFVITSVPTNLIDDLSIDLCFDVILKFESFPFTGYLPNYNGIVIVKKYFSLNKIVEMNEKTDRYGVVVKRTGLFVEDISIPPEDEVQGSGCSNLGLF
ncbi:hypothetical protein EDEG_03699 [Edhazardia aedis USNM 41457]|uniref:Elongator complex protein 4 n=1 Tax=Edhazardia aedis (strain USNM 41457) TaxID=1003232 RepID=J9D2J9_EDHAE|nr:hypothetical protein EDEG_03699 [Edhazardia aedis USNM 41457]|eukprot:EJW01809.1 hypothetical protein EDEG_03699 [Edhazardia aedis USNM 41457]